MWGNIDNDFIYTLLLTGKLALATAAILIIIGLPIAYWLAHSKYRIKILVETLISMPIVLPPTVMGYYLLVALSPETGVGRFFQDFLDIRFAFSFNGILI